MDDNLPHYAIHEAGHAVFAVKLGVRLVGVSIVPDHENGTGGCTRIARPRDIALLDRKSSRTRNWYERSATVFLAGYYAVLRSGFEEDVAHHLDDFNNAEDNATCLSWSQEEQCAYMDLLHIRARHQVRDPLTWAQIEAVADALLQTPTLSGRKVRALCKQAEKAYRESRKLAAEPPPVNEPASIALAGSAL